MNPADSVSPMLYRRLALLTLYVGLIAAGLLVGQGLTEFAVIDVRPSNEAQVHRMIMSATAVYVFAAAIPFIPGAEIGWALIVALGPAIVILVYLSMVAALTLSYTIGRFVPLRLTASLFRFLGLKRGHELMMRMAPLDARERLELLIAAAPRRIVPFLLRHRYFALAIALNIPGNTLVGGGGGLALVAGMSGIYRFPGYLLTVMIGVSPVPLLVLTTGAIP